MVTKHDFVKRVSEASSGALSQREVSVCMDYMNDVIVEIMKAQDSVKFGSIVTLSGEFKPAHTARNPLGGAGATVEVPDKIVPKAKFSKTVKEALNA